MQQQTMPCEICCILELKESAPGNHDFLKRNEKALGGVGVIGHHPGRQ